MRVRLVDDSVKNEDLPVSMLSGSEKVEAVIDLLVIALDCHLCHVGNFGDDNEYGKFDLWSYTGTGEILFSLSLLRSLSMRLCTLSISTELKLINR